MLIGYRTRGSVAALVAGVVLGWAAGFGVLFAAWPTVSPAGAAWERDWLVAAHGLAAGGLLTAARWVSLPGYPTGLVAVAAAFTLVWLVRATAWKGFMLFLTGGILWSIERFASNFFMRPLPALFATVPAGEGFGYPSGHALAAAAFFGYLAHLLARDAGRGTRRVIWIAWVLFALAMGGSRLVLGLHWPTDVLAGYAAGLVVLIGLVWGTNRWRPTQRR